MKKFDLVPAKHIIIYLSCILVVGLGIMAYSLHKNNLIRKYLKLERKETTIEEIKTQSDDVDTESIQQDLNNTDLDDAVKEIELIENELTQ